MIRAAILLTCALGLAACETAKGAGRDIEKAGQAIGNAASNVQKAL